MLSRVADSLYWLSLNIERAENTARLVDVNLHSLLDAAAQTNGDDTSSRVTNYWSTVIASLEENKLFTSIYGETSSANVIEFLTFEPKNPNSILSCLTIARENARSIRDYLPSEMWQQINRLYLYIRSGEARDTYVADRYDFYRRLIEGSHLFQGVTNATLTHDEGWHFMQIGHLLERADSTSRILDVKYATIQPDGTPSEEENTADTLQWFALLSSCSAKEGYLKQCGGKVIPNQIVEFLVASPRFPRSVRFCVEKLDAALHQISGCGEAYYANEAERLSGRMRYDLSYIRTSEIFQPSLHLSLESMQSRLGVIGSAVLEAYCLGV